ncbi:MAG: DHHW family protein [Bacilli bacterium]
MENKYVLKITSILICLFVLGFSIFFMFNPKKEFSSNENRYLEKWPKYSFSNLEDGSYIKKVESYLTDHFIFRDNFMGIKTSYQQLIGLKKINNVYLGQDYLIEDFSKPINTDKFIDKLNSFYLNNKDIKMNLMLVPNSISINSSKLPFLATSYDQKGLITDIYDKVNFDSINVYDTIYDANRNNQMYYRLDHHWTSTGAYLAYLEYCKANGLEPNLNYKIKTVTDDFNGTLYSKANIYNMKADHIDIYEYNNNLNVIYNDHTTNSLYEEKYLSVKDKYSYFLDNNHALIKIINKDVKTSKLLVIKDSYANSFIPFLVNNYEEVHVIDPRYYNMSISDYIKENKIDNVLFLYNLTSIDNNTGVFNLK